jgi:5-methyltetrahydropteroyltriglutamate--homocysteine methyltransferase
MQRSETRILTTHAGSLPRPKELADMLGKLSRGEQVDSARLERIAFDATRNVVAKQLEAGVDIGNNGEQSRESFFTYVQHRMSGFSGRSERPMPVDLVRYPTFLDLKMPDFARIKVDLMHAPKATSAVRYTNRAAAEKECADLRQIVSEQKSSFVEVFMTAPSPGIIAAAMTNAHYASLADYVMALGEALRTEYETIASHGLVLQIDSPDLAMERHTSFAERPLKDFLAFVSVVIGAINHAIANIPRERVRLHVCWGNYEGPHDSDVALEELLPHLYQARVGALMLSMANPRHAHEIRCFRSTPLPREMTLIAGVVDTTTNYIEHPEVVAERLERAAEAIGDPHRVMAGTDCGFETSSGLGEVAEELVWRKLAALSEGARLASKRLFV